MTWIQDKADPTQEKGEGNPWTVYGDTMIKIKKILKKTIQHAQKTIALDFLKKVKLIPDVSEFHKNFGTLTLQLIWGQVH